MPTLMHIVSDWVARLREALNPHSRGRHRTTEHVATRKIDRARVYRALSATPPPPPRAGLLGTLLRRVAR